jgi:hypothetical protein
MEFRIIPRPLAKPALQLFQNVCQIDHGLPKVKSEEPKFYKLDFFPTSAFEPDLAFRLSASLRLGS